MATRILLVAHAVTVQAREGRLPAPDDALELDRLDAFTRRAARQLTGPEKRCVATASTLGLHAHVCPGLADLRLGDWAGRTLRDLARADAQASARWMSDPDFGGHGGESVSQLVTRVGGVLDRLTDEGITVAVTSPAVVRAAVVAALGAPARSFFDVDVAALDAVEITRMGNRSRLRRLQPYPTWLARP